MRSDQATDHELVARVVQGDAEAFGLLFKRRRGDVYRFALHMTASPAIADDVTQETFLAVMKDAARYEPARATVAAWLCGIARNHVRRRFDRDRLFQPLDAFDGDEPDEQLVAQDIDPLGDLTRAELLEAVRDAVLALPIRYREAVVLCDLQELSYADAASALGCAVGTVRSRLHRGRGLLATKLARSSEGAYAPAVSRGDAPASTTSPGAAGPGPIEFARPRNARNLA